MSIEIHNVQRLRVVSEAVRNVDQSNNLASYTDVPFREGTGSVELTPDSLDPQHTVQHLDQYRKEVLGKRSAKLSFTVNLAPTGSPANATNPAVKGALGLLLKASMGGEHLGQGSTVVSATSASSFTVTSATGFKAGGVASRVNAAGQLEVREIKSVVGSVVTLKYAFSQTPSASDVIFSGATYYLTKNPSETLQFIIEGVGSNDRFVLYGGQLTAIAVAVDPSGAQFPSLQFTYEFAGYHDANEATGTITGDLGNATYSNYEPVVGHAGHLMFPDVGDATYSADDLVHASAITWSPKIVFARVTSPSGENTVLQWRRTRQVPVIEGGFTEPFQGLTRFTERDSRTDKACWYQMGRTAGYTVMLSAPTVQVVNPQRVADGAGFAAQSVAWKGRLDADTSGSDDLALSAFRIHIV